MKFRTQKRLESLEESFRELKKLLEIEEVPQPKDTASYFGFSIQYLYDVFSRYRFKENSEIENLKSKVNLILDKMGYEPQIVHIHTEKDVLTKKKPKVVNKKER